MRALTGQGGSPTVKLLHQLPEPTLQAGPHTPSPDELRSMHVASAMQSRHTCGTLGGFGPDPEREQSSTHARCWLGRKLLDEQLQIFSHASSRVAPPWRQEIDHAAALPTTSNAPSTYAQYLVITPPWLSTSCIPTARFEATTGWI